MGNNVSKDRLGWRYWPTVYWYALLRWLRRPPPLPGAMTPPGCIHNVIGIVGHTDGDRVVCLDCGKRV